MMRSLARLRNIPSAALASGAVSVREDMDSTEHLQRARRYRDLAGGMNDEQTRNGLLELAERLEALAGEMATDDRRDNAPS